MNLPHQHSKVDTCLVELEQPQEGDDARRPPGVGEPFRLVQQSDVPLIVAALHSYVLSFRGIDRPDEHTGHHPRIGSEGVHPAPESQPTLCCQIHSLNLIEDEEGMSVHHGHKVGEFLRHSQPHQHVREVWYGGGSGEEEHHAQELLM